MEGLRVIGRPADFAKRYAEEGADEILYLDTVASLYGRANLQQILAETVDGVFVPLTVGGGVRSEDDVKSLLRTGADKVALNTAAIAEPEIIARLADRVGSQAIVCSIEAKRHEGGWECYTDNGRNRTGKDARSWAAQAAKLGAGEILVTSVERDGTRKGAEAELGEQIAREVDIPVILAGGIGTPAHAVEAATTTSGVAIGAALHYGKTTIGEVKAALREAGKVVR